MARGFPPGRLSSPCLQRAFYSRSGRKNMETFDCGGTLAGMVRQLQMDPHERRTGPAFGPRPFYLENIQCQSQLERPCLPAIPRFGMGRPGIRLSRVPRLAAYSATGRHAGCYRRSPGRFRPAPYQPLDLKGPPHPAPKMAARPGATITLLKQNRPKLALGRFFYIFKHSRQRPGRRWRRFRRGGCWGRGLGLRCWVMILFSKFLRW